MHYICSIDGALYSKDKKILYVYPANRKSDYYVVGEETSTIACTAFGRAFNLKDVYFYNPKANFSTYTFFGCKLTIHGTTDNTNLQDRITRLMESAALQQTSSYGILTFEALKASDPTENEVIEVPTVIKGDINGDGKLSRADLTRLNKYFAGWDVEIDETAADVTGDGKVSRADLTRLNKYFAGWDVQLG